MVTKNVLHLAQVQVLSSCGHRKEGQVKQKCPSQWAEGPQEPHAELMARATPAAPVTHALPVATERRAPLPVQGPKADRASLKAGTDTGGKAPHLGNAADLVNTAAMGPCCHVTKYVCHVQRPDFPDAVRKLQSRNCT